MTTPSPGIYYDIPFDEYVEWPGLNVSTLLKGRKSMMHLKHYMDSPPLIRTSSMTTGVLGHTLTLEAPKAMARYVVMPDFASDPENRRADGSKPDAPTSTKWYKQKVKDFAAANITREVVTQEAYDDMLGMLKALSAHPKSSAALTGGVREVSIVWVDYVTGILRKGRIDLINIDKLLMLDLKVTEDASRFEGTIGRFGYHIRAASYMDGWNTLDGDALFPYLLAVEPKPPFGIRYGRLGDSTMAVGRVAYGHLMQQYRRCIETGKWPGYDDVNEWNLPGYGPSDETYGLKITTEAP